MYMWAIREQVCDPSVAGLLSLRGRSRSRIVHMYSQGPHLTNGSLLFVKRSICSFNQLIQTRGGRRHTRAPGVDVPL